MKTALRIWDFFIGIYFYKILSLPINRFMNLSCIFATLHIYIWLVKVVQHLMAVRQKDAKIMELAAPIAAIN